jgi:N-dimethylarginine dimethylaminohydrolase
MAMMPSPVPSTRTPTLAEAGVLTHVAVKHPREAFIDEPTIQAQWRTLGFTAPPDLARASEEHDRFVDILRAAGAEVYMLPRDNRTTLDSIYVRDASVLCQRGVVLGSMGKHQRAGEPAAQEDALPTFAGAGCGIAGRITGDGRLEGGDVAWLDDHTLIVGQGYRTNPEGIRQLRALVGPGVDLVEVPLPHWRGEQDVMHLMSLFSPVHARAAVVYSPLLPVRFRRWLLDRGLMPIEVPDAEFETMGTNVLAVSPGRCVMLAGNPRTRGLLERAGIDVIDYAGYEISVKGAGGPTCLTRPLRRVVTESPDAGAA